MTTEERFEINYELRRYNAAIHAAVLRDNWEEARRRRILISFKDNPTSIRHMWVFLITSGGELEKNKIKIIEEHIKEYITNG